MDMLEELIKIFEKANNEFIKQEYDNILSGVCERNLCANLKTFLDKAKNKKFKEYIVDVEYNRNDNKVKAIINDKFEIVKVTPDLILHSRGKYEKDNLICLEMKKSIAPKYKKEKDKMKLIALTRKPYEGVWSFDGKADPKYVCDYTLGIYYEINIKKKTIKLEYYSNGKIIDDISLNI